MTEKIKFTREEQTIIDDSIAFYRSKVYPDYKLDKNDKNTILLAMDYAHDKGQVIPPDSVPKHILMRSIQRKLGEEVEEPEERQNRLAQERYEKRHNILIEAKKQEAKEAKENYEEKKAEVKKAELQLEQVKAEDAGVAQEVIEAQAKAREAEQRAKEAEEAFAKLQAELEKQKQKTKELENSKEAIEELAKDEQAEIKKEVEVPQPTEEKSLEEKSIEELVAELKTSE